MSASRVVVFGVPSGAGGRRAAVAEAPRRLREAGLIEALRAAGAPVVDLGDLPEFPFREDAAHPKARNAEGVAMALPAIADQTARAVTDGFTLVLGGDCSIVAGTTTGARRALGEPVGLVFIDADADLNTPETTPSGFLHGMSVSLALGEGPAEVVAARGDVPPLSAEHATLVGVRGLDPGERARLGHVSLAVPAAAARWLGMGATAALALDSVENGDGPVVVHVDCDVVDPAEMTAKVGAPGPGLTFAEVSDLLAALCAAPRVVAIELCEYGPDLDPGRVVARKLIEVLARAVGRRFR